MLRRKRLLLAIGIIALVPIAAITWWFGSPLFINKTVEEQFPLAFNAAIPSGMTRTDVEMVMAGMSKVNQEVMEGMPEMMAIDEATDRTTNTSPPAGTVMPPSGVRLKAGEFHDADSFHRGSGRAAIYRGPDGSHLLRLEDFRVTNGPDLHVLLTPHPASKSRDDLTAAGYVDLGKLKGNIGNQNYPIPENVDVAAQGSVVIYCLPFHVIFSVAPLQDAS